MNPLRAASVLIALFGLCGLIAHANLSRFIGISDDIVILTAAAPIALGLGLIIGSFVRDRVVLKAWVLHWRVIRAALVTGVVMVLLMVAAIYAPSPARTDRAELLGLIFAAMFSGGLAYAELVQRYRDDPARLFIAAPTIVYVSVNMAAAICALALIKEFKVFDKSDSPGREVYEVLLASFGSIAFFRSSLFTARVGDKDLDVGPSTLLKSLLEASDRLINRSQARDRVNDVATIMRVVDFDKAKTALPSLCFTVVENLPTEEEARVATSINQLVAASSTMSDAQRSIILGTILMKVVGPVVLSSAVSALGDSIIRQTEATPAASAGPVPFIDE